MLQPVSLKLNSITFLKPVIEFNPPGVIFLTSLTWTLTARRRRHKRNYICNV